MASFLPGETVTLTVGPGSTRVALPQSCNNARVVNDSAGNVWVEFGDAAVVANPADSILLLPGQTSLFRLPARATHIAGIMADKKATGSLNITLGEGS
jgi:hypothetical protein